MAKFPLDPELDAYGVYHWTIYDDFQVGAGVFYYHRNLTPGWQHYGGSDFEELPTDPPDLVARDRSSTIFYRHGGLIRCGGSMEWDGYTLDAPIPGFADIVTPERRTQARWIMPPGSIPPAYRPHRSTIIRVPLDTQNTEGWYLDGDVGQPPLWMLTKVGVDGGWRLLRMFRGQTKFPDEARTFVLNFNGVAWPQRQAPADVIPEGFLPMEYFQVQGEPGNFRYTGNVETVLHGNVVHMRGQATSDISNFGPFDGDYSTQESIGNVADGTGTLDCYEYLTVPTLDGSSYMSGFIPGGFNGNEGSALTMNGWDIPIGFSDAGDNLPDSPYKGAYAKSAQGKIKVPPGEDWSSFKLIEQSDVFNSPNPAKSGTAIKFQLAWELTETVSLDIASGEGDEPSQRTCFGAFFGATTRGMYILKVYIGVSAQTGMLGARMDILRWNTRAAEEPVLLRTVTGAGGVGGGEFVSIINVFSIINDKDEIGFDVLYKPSNAVIISDTGPDRLVPEDLQGSWSGFFHGPKRLGNFVDVELVHFDEETLPDALNFDNVIYRRTEPKGAIDTARIGARGLVPARPIIGKKSKS